jgi:hypothetical protein
MVLHQSVYVEDAISAALFGRPKTKATRKVRLIFLALIAGEVTSVFTVYRCENMNTEKLISIVSITCHAMYVIES